MAHFIYNGKSYEAGRAVIGPDSRALRYGDGLFETFKSSNGQLLFAADHFDRLWNGLHLMQFNVPALLTPERLEHEIGELLKKNRHTGLARIRLTLFRGDGGLYDVMNHQPGYLVQTWALPENAGQWNSNGLVMGIHTDARKCRDVLSNLKHNNFLPYVLAALQAKKEKWNDAVVLNDAGRVCDSSIANIFIVKNGKVSTVSLEEGCIAGVMRKNIIRLLADHDIPVYESAITVDELMDADEVFVTNSILNARWVQQVAGKTYTSHFIQKIYSEILSTILK